MEKYRLLFFFVSIPQAFKAQLKAEPDFRYTNIFEPAHTGLRTKDRRPRRKDQRPRTEDQGPRTEVTDQGPCPGTNEHRRRAVDVRLSQIEAPIELYNSR